MLHSAYGIIVSKGTKSRLAKSEVHISNLDSYSYSSIRRPRITQCKNIAEDCKKSFHTSELLVIHWDGMLVI